jgi:hypothetical protein
MYGRYMDIRYELPNYFDGKNALTTPSVGVDNRGRSLVFGDTFSISNSVINSFRATGIRSINFRTPSGLQVARGLRREGLHDAVGGRVHEPERQQCVQPRRRRQQQREVRLHRLRDRGRLRHGAAARIRSPSA